MLDKHWADKIETLEKKIEELEKKEQEHQSRIDELEKSSSKPYISNGGNFAMINHFDPNYNFRTSVPRPSNY